MACQISCPSRECHGTDILVMVSEGWPRECKERRNFRLFLVKFCGIMPLTKQSRNGKIGVDKKGTCHEVRTAEVHNLSDMAAIDVGRLTEPEARTILEAIRWPDGPVCPHCGGVTVTRIQAKSRRSATA